MLDQEKIKSNAFPQSLIYTAGAAAGEICQKVLSSETYNKIFSSDFFRFQMHDLFEASLMATIHTHFIEQASNKIFKNSKDSFIGKNAKSLSMLLTSGACYTYELLQSITANSEIDKKDLAAYGVGIILYSGIDRYYKYKNNEKKNWVEKIENKNQDLNTSRSV
jgi:hypothetical protein